MTSSVLNTLKRVIIIVVTSIVLGEVLSLLLTASGSAAFSRTAAGVSSSCSPAADFANLLRSCRA